jgi:carbonic anhydrase
VVNADCTDDGTQSPIDVTDLSGPQNEVYELLAGDDCYSATLENNGHTWKVTPGAECDAHTVTYDGVVYTLAQMHFHSPSEHYLNGTIQDFEAHMVHAGTNGEYLVLGVFFNATDDAGSSNAFLEKLWDGDFNAGETKSVSEGYNPYTDESFVDPNTGTYTYFGSLTTPNCNRIVNWVVMDSVQSMSRDQLDLFNSGVAADSNSNAYNDTETLYTNRPLQSVGTRDVYYNPSGLTFTTAAPTTAAPTIDIAEVIEDAGTALGTILIIIVVCVLAVPLLLLVIVCLCCKGRFSKKKAASRDQELYDQN